MVYNGKSCSHWWFGSTPHFMKPPSDWRNNHPRSSHDVIGYCRWEGFGLIASLLETKHRWGLIGFMMCCVSRVGLCEEFGLQPRNSNGLSSYCPWSVCFFRCFWYTGISFFLEIRNCKWDIDMFNHVSLIWWSAFSSAARFHDQVYTHCNGLCQWVQQKSLTSDSGRQLKIIKGKQISHVFKI